MIQIDYKCIYFNYYYSRKRILVGLASYFSAQHMMTVYVHFQCIGLSNSLCMQHSTHIYISPDVFNYI